MGISTIKLPLYKPTSFLSFSANLNAGLWYDKFFDEWKPGCRNGLEDDGKMKWVRKFGREYVGDDALLDELAERRELLIKAGSGHALAFRTEGPMVSGLGRSHPVENGFAWHHVLGVPYLPGSSVKGVVRSYARNWLGIDDRAITRIFGPPQKGNHHHVGSVIFLDGVPILPVKLKAEIMTPHYVPYYRALKPEPPGDWHSPVPIPFLAVDEGGEFLFGLLPRSQGDADDCRLASEWLVAALSIMGAGAKTSSGYGRFSRIEIKNKGARWLAAASREKDGDSRSYIKESPRKAKEAWERIEDPKLKIEVANEVQRLYQELSEWDDPTTDKIKKFKLALEKHLASNLKVDSK